MQPIPLAGECEARGFQSLWFPEHSYIPTSRETPCGGRFEPGIGYGWNVEERRNHGDDFRQRREMLRACAVDQSALDAFGGRVQRQVRYAREKLGMADAGAEAPSPDRDRRRLHPLASCLPEMGVIRVIMPRYAAVAGRLRGRAADPGQVRRVRLSSRGVSVLDR
jgi:alkanesulfonate monooxygenase SsuD/methylene tetrahydromethanopterin reductase-like flavin-dependent oxidoreductase (luciferase family)